MRFVVVIVVLRIMKGQSLLKCLLTATPKSRKELTMLAIIETGGKQYQVKEGLYVDMELLDAAAEQKVTFDKVVMLVNGKKSKVGTPYVKNAVVEGVILKHDKDKKIIVYKQRPKKGYRRKQGHRQNFTRVMINKIKTSASSTSKASSSENAAAENKED